MEYMKIEDLEPGDIIKINELKMNLEEWNPSFLEKANKYNAVVKEVKPHGELETSVSFDFIDGNGIFIKNYCIRIHKSENWIDLVYLVDK